MTWQTPARIPPSICSACRGRMGGPIHDERPAHCATLYTGAAAPIYRCVDCDHGICTCACSECLAAVNGETTRIVLVQGDDRYHNGPGWYYWEEAVPGEGSIGSFPTRQDAVDHARKAGYPVIVLSEPPIVHLDNGSVFCEASEQGGLLTANEAEVTCPACLERLRRLDELVPSASVSSEQVDWFGEGSNDDDA